MNLILSVLIYTSLIALFLLVMLRVFSIYEPPEDTERLFEDPEDYRARKRNRRK